MTKPADPTPQAPARPPMRRWKKAVFALIAVVAFFALAELVLWAVGVPTLLEREDPFRGFSGLLSVYQRDGQVYRTRRALAGGVFNDQAFQADKPANGLRLFCLGGSSSYGYPWGAEAAFTSVLGEALAAAHPDRQVEAVNASGVSYAMHRINIVADELLGYQPDGFVVYEGHNEFIEPALFEELKHRGAARMRLEHVLAGSRIYSGMRAGLEWFKTRAEAPPRTLEADVRRDQTRTVSPKDKQAVVAEFRWRLERLVRRAQERGVKVLLSTVPCNLRQWRPEWSILEGLDEPGRRAWGEAFAAGQRAIESRDFAAAVSSLEQAARLAPGHAETQFLLGQAYEGLARWDDARRAYQLACDADAKPTRRLSAVNGVIRDVAGQTGALLVDMDKVFEEYSEHGLVGFNLIEDYVHPTREGHELIALHMWRAMEQGGWAGAATRPDQGAFDKVIARRHEQTSPPNPTWLRNQGVVLQNQGQLPAAMDKYRQCLALTPDDPVALLNLGSLLYEGGRGEEAVGFLERLAGLDGKNFVARNNLGNALMRLGKFTDAIRRYEEALAIQPEYAQGQANLGAALARTGDLAKAAEHFEHALRIEPTSALAHNAYALALAQGGKVSQAIDHFEQALRTRADAPEVHFNLGQTLLRAGRFADARGHFEQALKIQPNHPGIRFNLGLAQMKTGQIAEAVGSFQEALRIKPDMPEAHYNLGVCLCAQGKPGEGLTQWRQAIQLRPDNIVVLNDTAWLLATCPDASVRNGKEAVELASKSVQQSGGKAPELLDTLAVAYAEAGQFPDALQTARRAVELADGQNKPALAAEIRSRIPLYESGQAYRQGPPRPATRPAGP